MIIENCKSIIWGGVKKKAYQTWLKDEVFAPHVFKNKTEGTLFLEKMLSLTGGEECYIDCDKNNDVLYCVIVPSKFLQFVSLVEEYKASFDNFDGLIFSVFWLKDKNNQ